MAVPIRVLGLTEFEVDSSWIASQQFQSQTFHLVKPAGMEPDDDGRYRVISGTPYPANDASCFGLIINTTDVTAGSSEVAVMMTGMVYEELLPVELTAAAKTALEAKIIPRAGAWS